MFNQASYYSVGPKRDAQGSKKDTEVVRDFLMLQKGYDNEVQKQENQKGVSFHHILLFSFGGGHLLIHLSWPLNLILFLCFPFFYSSFLLLFYLFIVMFSFLFPLFFLFFSFSFNVFFLSFIFVLFFSSSLFFYAFSILFL